MKKDIVIESSDEAVDLGRRSMMSRFGLAASLTLAVPVLMTISTPTLANHRGGSDNSGGNCKSKGGDESGNANAISNKAASCSDAPPPPPDDPDDGLGIDLTLP
jgi:hypothetical protein